MYTFIATIHIMVCVVLVLVVLLQTGKGADIGAVFGGASTTIFGSSGAGNFLTKMTTGAAIVFMLTSLMLSYGALQKTSESVLPDSSVAVPLSAPVAGGQQATGAVPLAEAPSVPAAEGGFVTSAGTDSPAEP